MIRVVLLAICVFVTSSAVRADMIPGPWSDDPADLPKPNDPPPPPKPDPVPGQPDRRPNDGWRPSQPAVPLVLSGVLIAFGVLVSRRVRPKPNYGACT